MKMEGREKMTSLKSGREKGDEQRGKLKEQ